MPGALARFFPLPSEVVTEYIEPKADSAKPTESKTPAESSGKDLSAKIAAGQEGQGAKTTEKEGDKGKEPKTYADHALPPSLLRRLLTTLLERLGKLKTALSSSELRAVGSSLLIVYEGDPLRLSSHFAALDEGKVKWKEDEEVDDASSSSEESELEEEGDEGDEGDGKGKGKDRLPITLHLIDFAHTVPTPGRGPDEGVLRGLDHFMGLVEERLGVVEEAMSRESGGKEGETIEAAERGAIDEGTKEEAEEGSKDGVDDERETKKIKTT